MTQQKGIGMTRSMRAMSRQALGLPNAKMRSYRNRFYCAYAPGPYDTWAAMVQKGLAVEHPHLGGKEYRRFYLTKAGALAALEPGETLDPEDFPE